MDESEAMAEVVDARDGVTLRKRFEETDRDLPAVEYEFVSDREETVTVRVVEPVPETLDAEDLGFRGTDVSSAWQFKGPKIEFEAEFPPNAVRKTACAARGENATAIRALLEQPEIFVVEPAGSEASRGGPSERGEAAAGASDDGAQAADGRPDGGSLVDGLVAELRSGEGSAESRRFLEEEFGTGTDSTRSVEAKLTQLQADVSDVRAYTGALETFLDEKGSGREVIDRLETQVASLDQSVDELDATVTSHDDDLTGLRRDLDALETEVDSMAAEFDELSGQLRSVESTLEDLDESLPDYDVDRRIEEIEAELAEATGFAEDLKSAFND